MKTTSLALLGALLLVSSSAALACSCTSEDGRCSAVTRLGGGCYALCGSGACTSGRAGEAPAGTGTITFSGQGVSPSELQQRISDDSGIRFVFAAKKANDSLTVDIENASAQDLMVGLGKLGAAAVLQRSASAEEKAAQPMARHFSMKAHSAPAETVSRLLSEMFGDAFAFEATNPKEIVSLDLENVTLGDLRSALPRMAGIKLAPVQE
jgi:hypothetical protein